MSFNVKKELLEVGYFLSRLGIKNPPEQLETVIWNEAYSKFYATFGKNKTEGEFRNSLKNFRDHFDSHLDNSRAGWMDDSGNPQQLSSSNKEVFHVLQKLSDNELWLRIKPYAVMSFDSKLATKKIQQVRENGSKYFCSEFSGVKKIKSKVDGEVYVYHGLVVDCLRKYIQDTNPEAIVYNTQKIDLALEFSGNLVEIFEVKTSVDTQSIYTAVGQLYMNSAGEIRVRKCIVLPECSEKTELVECLKALNIKIIWFEIKGKKCSFSEID